MKKGLLFACAVLICFAFVAYAIPAKDMHKGVKETDVSTPRDYTAPSTAKVAFPGVVIGETAYADAWRGSAGQYGKNILVTPDGQSISVVYGAAAPGSGQGFVFGYSYDGGATWDNTVLDNSINIRIYPGGAMDAYDVPYIVWQDRDSNSIQWMKDEGGIGAGAWTSPDTLARDSMAWYLPSMNVTGDKMMISAFAHGLAAGDYGVGDYSIHMAMSNDLGATWDAPWGRLPLPYGWNNWTNNAFYPGWDQDDADWMCSPSGDTVIGFFELAMDTIAMNASDAWNGFWPAYKISYDGGAIFSDIQYFTPPPSYHGGGWWYMYDGAWIGDKPHFLFIWHAQFWNGLALFHYTPTVAGDYSDWTMNLVSDISGDQALNWNGGVCDHPTISYDESGNIFAVYQDMTKSSTTVPEITELFGAASTDGGATWRTPVQMTTSDNGLNYNIYAEQSENAANGKVHVMYHDSTYENIYYYDYPTANLLAAPVRPDPITLPCELVSLVGDSLDGAAGGPVGDGTVDVVSANPIYFIWSPKVPIDGTYELLASTTSDFSAGNYQFTNGYITRNYAWDGTVNPVDIGVIGMPSNGVWYWKVRSHRGAEVSPWSEVFDFDYTGTAINTTDWVTGVAGNPVSVTHPFVLSQSYPNPARDNAAISFSLPKAGAYSLKVYNVAGQVVRTMNGTGTAGMNTVNVNSRNLSNGVYFYQLTANNNTATKKMVVLK